MPGHDQPPATTTPDTDTVEVERFPDGSRRVRPDSDKQTGRNPPEEMDGTADDDAVSDTTTGDRGGTS